MSLKNSKFLPKTRTLDTTKYHLMAALEAYLNSIAAMNDDEFISDVSILDNKVVVEIKKEGR